jgi:hypothetical protein
MYLGRTVREEIKELKKADGTVARLIKLHYEPHELCAAYARMPDFECWDSAARVFIKSDPPYPTRRVVVPRCPQKA